MATTITREIRESTTWSMVLSVLMMVSGALAIGAAWPVSTAWAVGVLVAVALFSSGLARLMVSVAVRRVLA